MSEKYMNTTIQFIYDLESILNKVKNGYIAQFGNTQIYYKDKNITDGIEYEEFVIMRVIKKSQ